MNIIINNLNKKFKNKTIINSLNLDINDKYIYFLTSMNGSGKTTLLKCIFGDYNYSGQIINEYRTSYLPEKPSLPLFITVEKFLSLFVCNKDIDNYLCEFEIMDYKNTYINKLSKGTIQKVALIKTILDDADVFLFDEPLNGLDIKSRQTFMNEIAKLNQLHKIIIISTHSYDDYPFNNKKVLELC